MLLLVCPACSPEPGWAEEWVDLVGIVRQEPAIVLGLLLLFPLLVYVACATFFLVLEFARWLWKLWKP